jgi:hypothetical protein
MLAFGNDEFRRQVQQETGIKPEWAAEAVLDEACDCDGCQAFVPLAMATWVSTVFETS